jgi:pilus assembly protein Flp/PilA
MIKMINKFWKDEQGATAIEYGLIAALIAVVIVAGATAVGSNVGAKLNTVAANVNSAGN